MKSATTRINRLTVLLQLLLVMAIAASAAQAAAPSREPPAAKVNNPAIELWQQVRQRPAELTALEKAGVTGKAVTQVPGVDSTVLVNEKGELWRQYRSLNLVPASMWILGGAGLLLLLVYLLVARQSKGPPDSGKRLLRFESYERSLHWFMAVLFIFLGLSGLILLFGRPLLIPVLGKEFFSALASASKEGHNLLGPVFLVSILLFLARFWRQNVYERGDLTWLLKGGGFVGNAHPRAGFFNMGEKILFWAVVLVGLALSIAGLVLLFPNFGQSRVIMEGAHLIHTLGAVLLMLVVMGHIYMAVAVKGTMDGMTHGYSDLNWAKAHHSAWAEKKEATGELISREEVVGLSGTPAAPPLEKGAGS